MDNVCFIHEVASNSVVQFDNSFDGLVLQPLLLGHAIGDTVPAPVELRRLPTVAPTERQRIAISITNERGSFVLT